MLQSTVQLLLSISAILVKNIEHPVILQVSLSHFCSDLLNVFNKCILVICELSLSVCQALLCVDTVASQQCAQPQLVLAALEFLSFLGKIFVPPESQVITATLNSISLTQNFTVCKGRQMLFHF